MAHASNETLFRLKLKFVAKRAKVPFRRSIVKGLGGDGKIKPATQFDRKADRPIG